MRSTLSLWTEIRRQASRRRTHLALGFMIVLPMIILLAFEFGSDNSTDDNGGGQFGSLLGLARGLVEGAARGGGVADEHGWPQRWGT